jgi:hypothetical protein
MKIPFAFRSNGPTFIKTLPWSLLLLPGSYNGTGTWTGTASAGTSGSTNLVSASGAQPGLTSNYATFDGSTQSLLSSYDASTLVAQAGTTLISIVRFHATGPTIANTGAAYITQSAANPNAWGLTHNGSAPDGANMYCVNSTNTVVATAKQSLSLNTWYLHIGRWTSSVVRNRVNTTNSTDVSLSGGAGSTTLTAGRKLLIGANTTGAFHNMDLRLVAIAPSTIADADCTSLYNEAVSQGWMS